MNSYLKYRIRVLLVNNILSNAEQPLTGQEIIDILVNEYGFPDMNRKTIYDDIKAINFVFGNDVRLRRGNGKQGFFIER